LSLIFFVIIFNSLCCC